MIQPERIQVLNSRKLNKGRYVLYWMQQSQRSEYNHALEYAIDNANELSVPVVVYFGLTDSYPDANERHYEFMLEGLREIKDALSERGIQLVVQHCSPEEGVPGMARNASLIVADRGYLKHQVLWRDIVAQKVECPVVQVESDLIVPVEAASPKEEFTAGTFRPKINKQLSHYLKPLKERFPKKDSLNLQFGSFELLTDKLDIDKSVSPVNWIKGGTSEAKRRLDVFIEQKLGYFDDLRNDPSKDLVSHLSPYLHFGQVSSLYIALIVGACDSSGKEAFLEELIVRRELCMNFIHYNQSYDSFDSLPMWAKKTLLGHMQDHREYLYSPEELENANTHDEYWNAAQKEMVLRGKMHGYMRMYWGKKILEWSADPREAYRTACMLNNKYSLDGRDPASYTGVAWCFGKHDRAWKEREIFGKVRYMNNRGLERKFDIAQYVKKVSAKNF
ncbi:MAG: deoxyribodipyrimidine photo-lyase [Spirochaetota bacterium]|nr:MAG: deoxyribodipyrimidine photo-lyase [Spirochaetota bacterium]